MKLTEQQALHRIAAYCSKAERCIQDVHRKLLDWEQSPTQIELITKRLIKENFLNEQRFCESYIKDKIRFNKWGKLKITFELRKKKLPEHIFQPILDDVADNDYEIHLAEILKTKNKSIKAKDKYDRKNKLIRFALSRGFNMDLSIKYTDKILNDVDKKDSE